MMIKANGEYLDFDGDIETEQQIKLFEEISTSNGDFSYSFDLPKTNNNLLILGLPFPDTVKSIYQNVPCELIDESGFKVNSGGLQVNKIAESISCTFFGGNNDWFGLLNNPMSALHLRKYDVNLTVANIQASWLKTSGIVFPILDAGALVTRSFSNLKVEDFTACFYVKTLFKEIFNPLGIKLQGDLLEDGLYNTLTVASNGKGADEVTDRSSFVRKNADQLFTSTSATVLFQDETTNPYFDGAKDNFNNIVGTYTADAKMRVDLAFNSTMLYTDDASMEFEIRINGVSYKTIWHIPTVPINLETFNFVEEDIVLNQFDVLSVFAIPHTITGITIQTNSTIKITPTYIYSAFGSSSVPNWTQGEFVSNILSVFNGLLSYNADSKTLTINLFNKIGEKTPIDVSEDVTITEIDFSEFVSNYGKSNYFKYQEGNDEDLGQYNINNFISYGSGNLIIENDFIEESVNVIESDFTAPITYLNGVFNASLERIRFVELEEIEDVDVTSVTNSSGVARFAISNADDTFEVGDLVRIETNVDSYNGEWVINAVTSTYITFNGGGFISTATGTATLLRHQFTTDDSVYLFANVANIENLFYSSNYSMLIDNTEFTSSSLAYFNLLSNGRQINLKYKQSLSFGSVNNPLNYQITMLDTYWPIFRKILNDPVMLRVDAYFDRNKYTAIKSFLQPLRIKTNETNNLYYLNRITGYKSGHETCEGELIKL